jgi:transposase-like protein
MSQANKHYEAAFKLEVARMVVDQGLSVAQVVNDMKIDRTAVPRWVVQYRGCKPELRIFPERAQSQQQCGLTLNSCFPTGWH